MVRVRLGRSGLSVSPICYGTWQALPRYWGDQPREGDGRGPRAGSLRVRRELLRHGRRLWGWPGGGGAGEALKPLPRDEIVVATKVYHHFYPDGHRPRRSIRGLPRRECEASLARLQMDYIDLYPVPLLRSPDRPGGDDGWRLERSSKRGRSRLRGEQLHLEQLRAARRFGDYATLQRGTTCSRPSRRPDLCRTAAEGRRGARLQPALPRAAGGSTRARRPSPICARNGWTSRRALPRAWPGA